MNLHRQSKHGDSDGTVSDSNSTCVTLSNEPKPSSGVNGDVNDVRISLSRLSPASATKELNTQGDGDFTRTRIRKKDNNVHQLIKQTKDSGSKVIDLSRKGLYAIPDELFEIENLEVSKWF